LHPRPLQSHKRFALAPDQRRQHEQAGQRPQQQQLPDRIGRHHRLAGRIGERKRQHRQQHQQNAGDPGGARVGRGGDFGEQPHIWPGRL
jgi:hypothetical protein